MTEENEFEKMYSTDEFDDIDEMLSENSDVNEELNQDELIAAGNSGLKYDISKASKSTKGPERILMDGKEVVITEVEVILPKPESEWLWTKKKTAKFKPCMFVLHYDNDGQREYYSGMRVFERNGKYSDPVIQNDGKTQASNLKNVYAQYKGKKSEEVSMYEFLNFLASKPKALIEAKEFEYDEKITKKNIVVKFL